jgi:hypothetical protein
VKAARFSVLLCSLLPWRALRARWHVGAVRRRPW